MNRPPFDHFQYLLVHQLYRPILLPRPYFFLSVTFSFFSFLLGKRKTRDVGLDRQSSLGRRNTIETTRVQKRRKKRNDMETTGGWFDSWKVYFSYIHHALPNTIYFKLRIKSSPARFLIFIDISRLRITAHNSTRITSSIQSWKNWKFFKTLSYKK